jgi:hypothetical protein
MTDQTDLREFLHRMANEAGFAPVEPGPVVRKARRRLARTVGGTLLTAGALVVGAFVAANGLMNAARTQMPQPGGQPTPATTENGQAVGEPYSMLDGGVTFSVPPPWDSMFPYSDARGHGEDVARGVKTALFLDEEGPNDEVGLTVLADPLPVDSDCREGPAPADAEALARSIRSNLDLEATEPVAVRIAGIEALRMDVVASTGASLCPNNGTPLTEAGLDLGHRMRLFLLDLPEGLSARILAITINAPEPRFERAVEASAPIVDSFEFRTG